MDNVLVSETALMNIADAIRLKNGSITTYKPREMAGAITAIETGTMITGNNSYIEDEMLVIDTGGGGITPTGSIAISANGTYDVTQYAYAVVALPNGDDVSY